MMNKQMDLMQMIRQLQQSADPHRMILQMAQQNPSIQRALQMINGRTPQQVLGMARQMANQSGQNLEQLAHQVNVRLHR